jgi:hypothetical protein
LKFVADPPDIVEAQRIKWTAADGLEFPRSIERGPIEAVQASPKDAADLEPQRTEVLEVADQSRTQGRWTSSGRGDGRPIGYPAPVPARTTDQQIARFLRTGEAEPFLLDWPGQNILEKCRNGSDAMRDALLAEVISRAGPHVQAATERVSVPADLTAFTRRLIGPMVRGLFPRREVAPVLAVLERSVVFLTPQGIEQALRQADFLNTAWTLANTYLGLL